MEKKKSIMGPIISVFVMVLVISILAGLTFLFVTELKDTSVDVASLTSITVVNETSWINSTTYTLSTVNDLGFVNPVIVYAANSTDDEIITSGNYTLSSAGVLSNASAVEWGAVEITYTYSKIKDENSYENAGAMVVDYLPLIFLALIFGAILTLVLRIIIPYINLGKNMGEGF